MARCENQRASPECCRPSSHWPPLDATTIVHQFMRWSVHRNNLYGVWKSRPVNTSVLFASCWRGKKSSIFFIYNLFLTEIWFQRNLSQGAWCWLYAYIIQSSCFSCSTPEFSKWHKSQFNQSQRNGLGCGGPFWALQMMGVPMICPRAWCAGTHSWLLLDFQVQDPQCCKGYLKLLSAY